MNHLGTRISALVDGQLAPAEAERALSHVAACPRCSGELADARAAHAALAAVTDVVPDDDLTARLLGMAGGAQAPTWVAPLPPPQVPTVGDRLAAVWAGAHARLDGEHLPSGAMRGDLGRRGRSRRWAYGSLACTGAVAAVLFALGARPAVAPQDATATSLDLLAGAAAVQVTGTDRTASAQVESVAWLADHDWSVPTDLPAGWTATAVRWADDDGTVLEVDLAGPDGAVAVLTEQQGALDPDAVAGAAVVEVGGVDVLLLGGAPWHAAWQAGDCVVQLVAGSQDAATALVAAVPAEDYDDGVLARVARGWDTVTAAIEQG